ncbi:ABC transporter ATP-binding protein [Candidatus Bathyarchaeota archaeon]|nr:ABC transporter ATP-binding protein [Candidatus Bathyarchaeota archaeon]
MINVEGVTKSYGRIKVLDNVSLKVETGKTVGIVGPSGSGKTTLLKVITGLDTADRGTVSIDGVPASIPEVVIEPSGRNISAVFQVPALWPHMTVQENLDYVHMGERGNTKGLLESVGLSGLVDRYSSELSGGEARRVSIARGLLADKKYLLMDEPLVNLNPSLKKMLHEVIMEWTEGRRMGVLYITHDRSELDYADSVYALSHGLLEIER